MFPLPNVPPFFPPPDAAAAPAAAPPSFFPPTTGAAAPPPFFPPAAGVPAPLTFFPTAAGAPAPFLQQIPPAGAAQGYEERPFKKPRIPIPPSGLPPPNTGPNHPNYKTQMCPRFSNSGFCTFGERCTYAHAPHELRKRTCTMFSNMGSCRYGDRCMYAHTETMANRSRVAGVEGFAGERDGRVQKLPLLKSRICREWEMMGHCQLGRECPDAHGYAELKKYGNQMAVDGVAVPSYPLPNHKDTAAAAAPSYPPLNPTKDVSPPRQQDEAQKDVSPPRQQDEAQKDVPEPRRLKKCSGIYGDWVTETPIYHLV